MKGTTIAIGIAILLIVGAILFNMTDSSGTGDFPLNNVVMEGDTQVILISARGGYSPRVSEAKANVPTVLRVESKGTYDCSASLVVPEVSYRGFLKPTGVEEIKLPPQKSGATIRGLCSMGMYSFSVNFK